MKSKKIITEGAESTSAGKKYVSVLIGVFVIFLCVIFSYFFPENIVSKVILHINDNATIIIMVLTLVYVITTNRQLIVMKDQISVMKNEINLQAQPIPIPEINNCYLEKIRPLGGPHDDFMTFRIMSRFFSDISFNNIGNGAALNVAIYPEIKIGEECIPSPFFGPESSHCISEKLKDPDIINLMMFDSGLEIAEGVLNEEAIFALNIYYKNIFGKGFHEYISYRLMASGDDENWIDFFDGGIDKYRKEIDKHNALKPIDKKDAGKILDKLREELSNLFQKDLPVKLEVLPDSYQISIIEYEKEIQRAEKRNGVLMKKHFRDSYDAWKDITD